MKTIELFNLENHPFKKKPLLQLLQIAPTTKKR